ncbi:MFS transporter Ecym_3139 [Eremothecium cymbalariae DBVPG|uniref:Autophagy-related protein n=1 Tax=Eremothecium cymbalariae (strain CBS 270.75 / DBVPG 7215 / KCTC 17166 / NRRL Y-17582) TaxID=931890 RepID=G8JR74_ERECY|nr:Hypothetical protein Ecym_3139 [Eremothecium cymbalariae DBVPG\
MGNKVQSSRDLRKDSASSNDNVDTTLLPGGGLDTAGYTPTPELETSSSIFKGLRESVVDRDDTWGSKALGSWLLLCYSTGPTSAMMRSYVIASMQSIAHALGHPKGNPGGKCPARGDDCYINIAGHDVQYMAYQLYLKAAYTSVEGLLAIMLMGLADYSNYRGWLMISSIFMYGALAVPFVGFAAQTYTNLIAITVLYCVMLCCNTIYTITEGSYIPIFMTRMKSNNGNISEELDLELESRRGFKDSFLTKWRKVSRSSSSSMLHRGAKASVWGLIMGNLGGITAMIIAMIITQTRNTPTREKYKDFLLSITVAGCITIVLGSIASLGIPSVSGRPFPFKKNENRLLTIVKFPFIRLVHIIKDLLQYREAFKFAIAWVIWNIAYSNFMQLFMNSFRTRLGIGQSDKEYTVWQFTNYIVACMGPLVWMYVFRWASASQNTKAQVRFLKYTSYCILAFGTLANFWGSLGSSRSSPLGFKNRWEFWFFLVFFVSSSSVIRSLNRVAYSAMLPEGKENQYFGLEIMLGLATGWSQSLIIGVIQDRTGNSNTPYIPNTALMLIAMMLYYWCDIEKGMDQVGKLGLMRRKNIVNIISDNE